MTKHPYRTLFAMLAIVTLLGACGGGEEAPAPAEDGAAPAAQAPAAGGTATIAGVITYANGDPDAPIQMDADPVCQSLHSEPVHTQKVVVDDAGNLANVFVYVKQGAPAGSAPSEPHKLDQQGCQYHPHVSGMVLGQKLVIRNSDPTLHNVHALPQKNTEFNQGQPFEGMELTHEFSQPEVMIPFKCDVHPWMRSYMAVLEHPYFATSAENGSYSIGSLPAGTYTIEAWHEELGTQTQEVTVADGETVEVAFDFQPTAG